MGQVEGADMTKSVTIPVDPIAIADRLRKRAYEATDENRHDDALLMNLAANLIGEMAGSRRRDEEQSWRDLMAAWSNSGYTLFKDGVTAADIADAFEQRAAFPTKQAQKQA